MDNDNWKQNDYFALSLFLIIMNDFIIIIILWLLKFTFILFQVLTKDSVTVSVDAVVYYRDLLHPFIHSFIHDHSFIHIYSSLQSYIHSFIHSVDYFTNLHPSIHSFILSHSFIPYIIHSFTLPFTFIHSHSFIYSFILPFIHLSCSLLLEPSHSYSPSFIHAVVYYRNLHSSILPFIHSFIFIYPIVYYMNLHLSIHSHLFIHLFILIYFHPKVYFNILPSFIHLIHLRVLKRLLQLFLIVIFQEKIHHCTKNNHTKILKFIDLKIDEKMKSPNNF